MFCRMRSATIGAEAEDHGRRAHVAAGAVITQIYPQVPGPAAVAIAQQGDRRVVTMNLGGFPDIGEQPLAQRRQQPCQFPCPAAHHVPIDVESHAAKDH
jgi:hypothetical protein